MGAKILLADDSITIQKVVELTFSKEDYEIIAVNNGEDAIKKAKEIHPDLLLVDVIMPLKNGYEVCEALRADPSFNDVPILLLAGTFETFDENEGRRVGANDFVTKPFESQILVGKVKQLLEEAKSRPPAVATAAARSPQEEIAALELPEEEILILPEEAIIAEGSLEALKEEKLEEEPEFHLPPEVRMEEELTILPPPLTDSERELKKMGFWEPPKTAAPKASVAPPALPAPLLFEKEPQPVIISEGLEKPLFELEALDQEIKEGTPSPAKPMAEEKLWELADLGKTEIIMAPPTAPLASATPPPAAELPPLDLSDFTKGEPSLEHMAAELGLDIKEAKAETLSPLKEKEPEPVTITPSRGEAPPEFLTFETLGDAASMELGAEEAPMVFEPTEKIEPVSIPQPFAPVFEPVVEGKPPVKATMPMEFIPTVYEVTPSATPAVSAVKEELVEAIAQRVVKELAEKILERVAWEVIPELAEILIIKEIERIKAKTQEKIQS
jgi:DNA-binding response OmpR family regulator